MARAGTGQHKFFFADFLFSAVWRGAHMRTPQTRIGVFIAWVLSVEMIAIGEFEYVLDVAREYLDDVSRFMHNVISIDPYK